MAIIPSGTKFHGLDSSVNTQDKGSQSRNSLREAYTIEDIRDTVEGGTSWESSQVTLGSLVTSIWLPETTDANANAAIKPKGTGANVVQDPDGTATGGNARGDYATDWQKSRNANTQVAFGDYSTLSGGSLNTANGSYSTVSGGYTNGTGDAYATVSGGRLNSAGGGTSTVSGGLGNNASATESTVGGGKNNTSSGTRSFTASGELCTASGAAAVALGDRNQATGSYSSVLYGRFATVTSDNSMGGGFFARIGGQESVGFGTRVRTYAYGQFSQASGDFGGDAGQAQVSQLISRREADLTTGGTTTLHLDGASQNFEFNTNNKAANVLAEWVAVVDSITGTATGVSVGDVIAQDDIFLLKEVGGTLSIVGSVTNTNTKNDTSQSTASMAYSTTSNELGITFTGATFSGGGTLTYRIVHRILMVEVEF